MSKVFRFLRVDRQLGHLTALEASLIGAFATIGAVLVLALAGR